MSLILPGENPEHILPASNELQFGPGIRQSHLEAPRASNAGILQTKTKVNKTKDLTTTVAYIDTNSKRYVPSLYDHVIAIVTGRTSNGYKVSLQEFSNPVSLDAFAFENATKKNRPNLDIGTVVYGRVTVDDPDIESCIECFDSASGKSNGFGELKGGTVVDVSLGFARELLKGKHSVLSKIGEKISYEVAIGVNGKIWVNAGQLKTTAKVADIIAKAQHITQEEATSLVSQAL